MDTTKSKAQLAYEAYPLNQNAPPWNEIGEYRKKCWQKVVDALETDAKNDQFDTV